MLEPNHRSTKYSDIETRIDNHLNRTKYEYDKERIRQEKLSKASRPFSNYTAMDEMPVSKDFRVKGDITKVVVIYKSRKPLILGEERRVPEKEVLMCIME